MAALLSELSFGIDCIDFTFPRMNVHLSENIEKIPKANNGDKTSRAVPDPPYRDYIWILLTDLMLQ